MSGTQREDISDWASRIDTVISNIDAPVVRRVVVIESASSTQDAACEFAQGRHGLLLVASEQTNGRGSSGREWFDADRCTLPCTFTIDPGGMDAPMLSASVACALHETLGSVMGGRHELRIKWPNDLVVRVHETDRKVAGILIEQRAGLTLVGIGINCSQSAGDWGPDLRSSAVSLGQLGVHVSRLDLVCRLVEHMSQWFDARDRSAIREYYEMHNAMVGTVRTLRHNNISYHGVIEHIDPLGHIVIDTPDGVRVLPIAQTVHDRGDGNGGRVQRG